MIKSCSRAKGRKKLSPGRRVRRGSRLTVAVEMSWRDRARARKQAHRPRLGAIYGTGCPIPRRPTLVSRSWWGMIPGDHSGLSGQRQVEDVLTSSSMSKTHAPLFPHRQWRHRHASVERGDADYAVAKFIPRHRLQICCVPRASYLCTGFSVSDLDVYHGALRRVDPTAVLRSA